MEEEEEETRRRIKTLILNTKGVNPRSKYVTQAQQQRPESPTVTGMRVNTRYITPPEVDHLQ